MGKIHHTTLGIVLFAMTLGLHSACTHDTPTIDGLRGGDASSGVDGGVGAALDASATRDGGGRDAADAAGPRPDAGDVTRMAIDHLDDEYCAWRARCSGAAGSCAFDPFGSAERSFISLESFDPEKIAALAACFHDLVTCEDDEDAIARCVAMTTLNHRLVVDCFEKDACTNTLWGRDWCAIAPLLDDQLESNLSRCAALPDCAAAETCLADMGIVE